MHNQRKELVLAYLILHTRVSGAKHGPPQYILCVHVRVCVYSFDCTDDPRQAPHAEKSRAKSNQQHGAAAAAGTTYKYDGMPGGQRRDNACARGLVRLLHAAATTPPTLVYPPHARLSLGVSGSNHSFVRNHTITTPHFALPFRGAELYATAGQHCCRLGRLHQLSVHLT